MAENKTSKAQLRAIKKWQVENREKSNFIKKRSVARCFIKNNLNFNDLEEFKELIKVREDELTNQNI